MFPDQSLRRGDEDSARPRVAARMLGIVKRFGPTEVLHGVDFQVRAGEIHALVGENGAGKSTLMKILSGVYQPDAGEIQLNGAPVHLSSLADGFRKGVAMVFQELSLVANLSVTENIFLGQEKIGALGRLDHRYQGERASEVLNSIQANVSPNALIGDLPVSARQFVEIGKALTHESQVLIFDEPTAPLGPQEVERLFSVLRLLRDQGKAIVYISHRLKEVFQISELVAVLKDGNMVGERKTSDTSPDEIVRMMVGRELADFFPPAPARASNIAGPVPMGVRDGLDLAAAGIQAEPVLRVENLELGSSVNNVSFDVNPGEVVGIAGLEGSGMRELIRCIFGAERRDRGSVIVCGRICRPGSVRDTMRAGMGFVSDDRKGEGLILGDSIADNIALPSVGERAVFGFINFRAEHATVAQVIDKMTIQSRAMTQAVSTLSGGNQQKVCLGKWLPRNVKVLVTHEPTRGVDVGAKAQIYRLMRDLGAHGSGVLVASTDLMELLGLCDRILVLRNGQLVGDFNRGEATEENIIASASGHTDFAGPENSRVVRSERL